MADRTNWSALVANALIGTVVVPLAPITPTGQAGSMTFKNGILSSVKPPT